MRPCSTCIWNPRTALRRRASGIRTTVLSLESARRLWISRNGGPKFAGSWNWRRDSLTRLPRGYDPDHPFIEDIKRKDFVASIAFTDRPVCGPAFMRDFAAACRTMAPLVEFTTKALGLKL